MLTADINGPRDPFSIREALGPQCDCVRKFPFGESQAVCIDTSARACRQRLECLTVYRIKAEKLVVLRVLSGMRDLLPRLGSLKV